MLAKEVDSVDDTTKVVTTKQGDNIEYTHLVLAVGSGPKKLGVPGEHLEGVTELRSLEDMQHICSKIDGQDAHVVVIGSSFIGMEVASILVDKVESITVVGRDSVPFRKSLGEKVGEIMMQMNKKKGIQFRMVDDVLEFTGEKGIVECVKLKNSEDLKADLVIVAIGVLPRSCVYGKIPGLDMDANGRILVDKSMASTVPGIWAAGDIVSFPLSTYGDKRVSVEHWSMAMFMGKVAAMSIMGHEGGTVTVPFFCTEQFGSSIRIAGHNEGYDDIILHYGEEDNKWVAFYCVEDLVVSVATLNRDPVAACFANLRRAGLQLKKADALSWAEHICIAE